MTDQYRRSTLSQTNIRRSLNSSRDVALLRGQGFSTQLWGLVPGASISGNSSNSSPFLSMTQQRGNVFYSPNVSQVDAIMNTVYNPLIRHSSDHHPTLYPLLETSVTNAHQPPFTALFSLPDDYHGPQTQVKVPDDQFAVKVDSMADRALSKLYPRFDTDTPQSHDQMPNGSRTITNVVDNLSDHERSMTQGTQFPVMPFGAKPFPDDCSGSPPSFKHSTSGSTRLRTIPQEANRASQTLKKDEHLASAPGQMANKLYQCSSCCVIFAQRQGLTRHSKDKHEPKERCSFCVEFTWSQGRRYIYQRHLQEEHPDVVSPSVSGTLAAPRRLGRGINLKGQYFRQNAITRRIS
ncbi:hypothetical protein BJY52DRAFT_1317031 [Lactarius psammicola]|nr:hypothetical protein BJY52DRAFT_1317031 [Lactarius psammicola]